MPVLHRARSQEAGLTRGGLARGRAVQRLQRATYHGGHGGPLQPQPRAQSVHESAPESVRESSARRLTTMPSGPQEYPGGSKRAGARSDPWAGSPGKEMRDLRHGRTYNAAAGVGLVLTRNSTGTLVSVPSTRLEPQEKPRLIAAHDEFITGDLLEKHPDEERDEHDRMLADTLHKRGPFDVPHPWLGRPRNPMNTAFTDRAVRLRDGRGTKAHTTAPAQDTECKEKATGPSKARAAGAASHVIWSKKVHPLAMHCDSVHLDDFWRSDKKSSELVGDTLASKPPTMEHEVAFRKKMCGKAKAVGGSPRSSLEPGQASCMLPHRPCSPGGRPPAGLLEHEHRDEGSFKVRQIFQGSRSCSPPRSGVAMVLSPRPGDSPVPTKISTRRRANGEYQLGFSSTAAGHAKWFNPSVFRFSDPCTSPRTRHAPVADLEGMAGLTTDARAAKAERMFTSPSRLSTVNSSLGMSYSLDGALQAEMHAEEREYRLKHEKTFSDLCTTASQHALTQKTLMSEIKSLTGHTASSVNLTWVGAEE